MKSVLSKISLRIIVNWLERAIITLSGPAIAISGIIAGVDLLTGGTMFKDVHWLSLTWAICLLLTLDFNVLSLGTKTKQVYASNKPHKQKIAEIILIILIAAAISSVSVQMQSIIARTQATVVYTDRTGQHIRNLTIDEATAQMGINPVALIWERSALVLVLIFMSGWFRDEESQDDKDNQSNNVQPTTVTAQAAQPVINYEQLAQAVAPLLAQSLMSNVQQPVQRFAQPAQPPAKVEEIAQGSAQQAVIAQHSTAHVAHDVREDDDEETPLAAQPTQPVLHIVRSAQPTTQSVFDAASPAQAAQDNARSKVFAYLDAHPGNLDNNEAVMVGAGVNVHAARRYRREYKTVRGGAQ